MVVGDSTGAIGGGSWKPWEGEVGAAGGGSQKIASELGEGVVGAV